MKHNLCCVLAGVAVFASGVAPADAIDIYVSKFSDGSIWKLDSLGVPHTFAAAAPAGASNVATELAFGPDNNFYEISEANNQILKFNGLTGAYMGVIINGGSGLNGPFDMAFGPDGNLYVTSLNNDKILKYTTGGTLLGQFNAPGTLTQPTSLKFASDGSLYVASYSQPFLTHLNGTTGASLGTLGNWSSYDTRGGRGLAIGPDGDLFIGSANGGVLEINPTTGLFEGVFAFIPPFGLGTMADGFADGLFYVSSSISGGPNGGVLKFDGSTGAYVGPVFYDTDFFRPGGLVLIPEPGSLAILGVGLLALIRRNPGRRS